MFSWHSGRAILLGALMGLADLAGAEPDRRFDREEARGWRISLGVHLAERDATLHYERKDDPAGRTNDIGDPPQGNDLRALAQAQAAYAFDGRSALELEYTGSSTDETGVVRRTTRFLFVPLRLAVRVPVRLETSSLKLRYVHTVLSTPDWRLAASAGIRDFRAKARYYETASVWQTDRYHAYLPVLGAGAAYRWSDRIVLAAKADFLPLRSRHNRGSIGDAEAAVEYRAAHGIFLGMGYRYAQIALRSDRAESRGKLSYVTHGPMAYVGASF